MTTVDQQIRSADRAISDSISALKGDRGLLSQTVLAQLRNLVEAAAVRLHTGDGRTEYTHEAIQAGVAFAGSAQRRINVLFRFHKLLQESVSHYTMDGDTSERLMLKYYEYLIRLRVLLRDDCSINVLANLEDFPVDLDPLLKEYYEKIAERIDLVRSSGQPSGAPVRYYIHTIRPFVVGVRIYYEVTFRNATDRVNKSERIIAFTDVEITGKYAGSLTVVADSIEVLGRTMPITIILDWEVSIRPCELNNFARLLGFRTKVQSVHTEYRALMEYLTGTSTGLLDLITLSDSQFQQIKTWATERTQSQQIFPALEKARGIVATEVPGHNLIRYLMLRMNNVVLKQQYSVAPFSGLSNLNVKWGCKPFDTMPFCTSPIGHNPRISDLIESLDAGSRTHELLARRVMNNVEQEGMLYSPVDDLERFGDLDELVAKYNDALYFRHKPRRRLVNERGYVFMQAYEDDTYDILTELQEHAATGIGGYEAGVKRWLDETTLVMDDPIKVASLESLFAQSNVALIYGAAGTGKSTMINYIANFFHDKSKLFLAHTNPAVNNLQRRVSAQNSTFATISSHLWRASSAEYDILFIDECSIVSNADMLRVLQQTSFKLLVLVGDVYQIESINFGNWFKIAPAFLPQASVFELTTPFRTKNANLLRFWTSVRQTAPDVEELLAHYGYSTVLDDSLFKAQRDDEILLCLNYDGLYGINNINRFLQSSNPESATAWGVSTYKVGDPILFTDSDRFRGVIYNNLKGRIVGIEQAPGSIQFDVEIDRVVTAFDVWGTELEWRGDSTVRFTVHEHVSSDDDDESTNTAVPFQVAYAVSIHKAQGLEYDSVKLVITNANEDNFNHSIFYTAVTRAREELRIFWTPETQNAVLGRLSHPSSGRDVGILSSRRGLQPATSTKQTS